jgi:hypothetical protein
MMTSALRTAKADVRARYIVNFRLDPAVAASVIPVDWLEPQIVDGAAVLSFCPYVLTKVRLGLSPRCFGVEAICSAYRLAVIDRSGGEARRAAWVTGRETDARTISALGPSTVHASFARVAATVVETAGATTVDIAHLDGQPYFRATMRHSDRPSGTMFPDSAAFQSFFTAAATSWAPSADGRSWSQLDLDAGETKYSPLSISAIAAPSLPSGAEPDSAFIGVGGSYRWSCASTAPA